MNFLGVSGLHLGKMNSVISFSVGLSLFFAGIKLVNATGDRAYSPVKSQQTNFFDKKYL